MSQTTTAPTAQPAPGLDQAIAELAKVLRSLGRDDLVERATAAGARLKRPGTIVCVVGEFKQGKSSLVNGLLGSPVCPVDDDLATSAITLVRHGEQPAAVVRRRDGDETVKEQIPVEELGAWVSEQGNPDNGKRVERVDITVPAAILRQGLMVVDTPGMGGLGAGHAAATLAFLPFADGLVFVSDASAELSAPEVEFLGRARELCPTVLFAQTKCDLYPAWERIVEINRGHLSSRNLDIPIAPVSSTLRAEAMARRDRTLNERSRFPELITRLGSEVIDPAKADAEQRSATDIRGIAALASSSLDDERRLLENPAELEAAIAEYQRASERLEHLRGPGARWSVVVGDGVADLSSQVTHTLRQGMREVSRLMDERVETLKTGQEWDEVSRDLQSLVAEEVAQAFVTVEEGRKAIRDEAASLLQDEHLALVAKGGRGVDPTDVSALWRDKPIDEPSTQRRLTTGLTGLRGAQGGVIMLGMMGNFLPAAAATLVASNPVLLGAGALFGGVQLAEDRKRKVAARRQSARQQVRQFVDEVQFEVTNELNGLVREIQREMRDDLGARLGELQRTYTETAKRAQTQANRTREEIKARAAEIEAARGALAKATRLIGAPGGT
ncbi:MAG: dynamin family protein [Acidimicrobiales bacterium]|nr:dynamin family protein [Acidimicrobiales bacterium]